MLSSQLSVILSMVHPYGFDVRLVGLTSHPFIPSARVFFFAGRRVWINTRRDFMPPSTVQSVKQHVRLIVYRAQNMRSSFTCLVCVMS
jgi:hypothetical protein